MSRWDPPFFPPGEAPPPPESPPSAPDQPTPAPEPTEPEPSPPPKAEPPPEPGEGEVRPDLSRSNVLVVRNRTRGLWMFGWLGIPMVLFGAGTLFGLQPFPYLLELLYPGESRNPPAIETRDRLWGWMLLIVGALLLIGMLWKALVSHPALEVDALGILLPVNGPGFSRRIPWEWVDDIYADEHIRETDRYPALFLRLNERARLPRYPWGARVGQNGELAIPAGEWNISLPFVVQWLRAASEGLPTGASPTKTP